MRNFIFAVATLVGTIIGVGMFGLPYVASQVGLKATLFYLVILAAVVTLLHLIYGEIILRTKEKHRLAGYAEIYLGAKGKWLASIIFFSSLYLALLAYLLVGGEFLSLALSGWVDISANAASLILAGVGFGVVFKGIKLTGFFELLMTFILLAMIFGLIFYGAIFMDSKNLIFSGDTVNWFLPYGIILFALSGGSAIPEIRSFFNSGKTWYKKAIILGTLTPAVVYAIFIITVLGISGSSTSPEAISGLTPFFGDNIIKYGAWAGFLAVITSFFTMGLNIKHSFLFDFKLSKKISFLLTAAVPLFLFLMGLNDFIRILSWAGSVLGGFEGLLLIWIWRKAKKAGTRSPEYSLKLPRALQYVLVLMFAAGIFYQFIY